MLQSFGRSSAEHCQQQPQVFTTGRVSSQTRRLDCARDRTSLTTRPCPAAAKSAAAQLSGARPAAAREADQAGPSSMHEASDNLTAHSINQSRADGDSADESSLDMLMSGPSSDSQPLYDEFEPSPSGYSESEYYEDPAMDRAAGLEEYEALRRRLQARTLRFGLAVTAYIALTGTTEASFCCVGGLASGLVYFNLLRRQVEAMQPGAALPYRTAQQISAQPVRAVALGFAAYSYAIRPRLLIPAALAAGVAAWNSNHLEPQLGWGDEVALIIGFLSFKAALLLQVWDDTKPRVKTLEELRAPKRPVIEIFELDDTPFDLRKRTGR